MWQPNNSMQARETFCWWNPARLTVAVRLTFCLKSGKQMANTLFFVSA
jgi:hypothetical protein